MARSYASIVTSIWRDEEFCNLSAGAQRTYFMLVSQPEISAAGVLALTVSRWSKTLPVGEREHLADWLNELADHSYICLDWDTEELLVRSFIRWDRGYNNPKRQPVIREAMGLVTSPDLQSVLRSESDRLGFDYRESLSQVNSLYRKPGKAIPENDDSHRVVVTKVGSYRNPQPATHNPRSVADHDDDESPIETRSRPVNIDARKLSREYTDRIGLVDKAKVAAIVKSAQFTYSDEQITAALGRLCDRPDLPLTANVIRIEIETNGGIRGRPSTTDERVGAGLALAAELDAEAKSQRPQIGA